MNKSKIDFISDFLANNRLDSSMKEKFFDLAAKELQIENASYKSITKRIEKLERQVGLYNEPLGKIETQEVDLAVLKKYIDPRDLSKFLIAYNQDPLLKYTCHCIDDEGIIQEINALCSIDTYSLEKHQEILIARYRQLQTQFLINPKIKSLILVYLTGLDYYNNLSNWSSDRIKANWNSQELRNWSNVNLGMVPHPGTNLIQKFRNRGFKLDKPFKSNLTGKRISTFSDLVIHFKNLFHLRGDNSIRDLIDFVNRTLQWNDKIDFEFDEINFYQNLELFTDVDKFIQAYKDIIRMILDVVGRFNLPKPRVVFKFKEDNGGIFFSIHHINTSFRKTIADVISRPGEKETLLINNLVNGLCELHIRADFGNNSFAKINLWDGNGRKAIEIEQFNGVEYILKFIK